MIENIYYPLSALYRQLTIDPGGGGKNSDESAIVVTAWAANIGHAFVLDIWHDRVTTENLIEKIFELAGKWDVHTVRPERAAMQKTIEDWFVDQMRVRNVHYVIDPALHKRRGKGERIDALQPYIANHQVSFRADQQDIIKEATNLIISDGKIMGRNSPNMMDALAYHIDRWNSNPFTSTSDIDGIRYIEDEEEDIEFKVRYGLECQTRSRRMIGRMAL